MEGPRRSVTNRLSGVAHRTLKLENRCSGFKLGVSTFFPPRTRFRLVKLKMPVASLNGGRFFTPGVKGTTPLPTMKRGRSFRPFPETQLPRVNERSCPRPPDAAK